MVYLFNKSVKLDPVMSLARGRCLSLANRRLGCSSLRSSNILIHQRFSSNHSDDIQSLNEPTKYTLPTTGFQDDDLSNPVIKKFFINYSKCASCGIALQHTNPEEPGYSKKPHYKRSDATTKAKDAEYDRAYAKLDEEGKKLLEESTGISNVSFTKLRRLEEKRTGRDQKGERVDELKCVRCYNALHHSKMDLQETRSSNIESVLNTIPDSAEIVHVVSAYDFPLGLMTYPKGDRKSVV